MLPTVFTVGRLVQDPQLSYTTNQTAVVEFCVASDTKFGQNEYKCFLNVKAFSKTAEFANKYFKKGKPIQISGSLQTESWQAQDGSKRSKVYCVANQVGFVPKEAAAEGQAQDKYDQDRPVVDDDSIPF